MLEIDWPVYDSPIAYYDSSFAKVLNGVRIADLIRDKKSPVVLDLMASTSALTTLFEQLPYGDKFGLAVSLEDKGKEQRRLTNQEMGISHIVGDLNKPVTWDRIKQKLGGRKADLIMQRAGAGLQRIPVDIEGYKSLLQDLWDFLAPSRGIMLMQTPSRKSLRHNWIPINRWVKLLEQNGVGVCYIPEADSLGLNGIIRIDRTPDSPSELPFICR